MYVNLQRLNSSCPRRRKWTRRNATPDNRQSESWGRQMLVRPPCTSPPTLRRWSCGPRGTFRWRHPVQNFNIVKTSTEILFLDEWDSDYNWIQNSFLLTCAPVRVHMSTMISACKSRLAYTTPSDKTKRPSASYNKQIINGQKKVRMS